MSTVNPSSTDASNSQSLAGLLLGLDGVLYTNDQIIPGALETLETIKASGIPYRFITNTSTQTIVAITRKLENLGISVAANEIFSAITATRDFLHQQGDPSINLLVADQVKDEFENFRQDVRQPDFVVVGDIGGAWNYQLMNQIFRQLTEGAQLITVHKNRFWQTENGLRMDIGAFVAGLEYASGREAIVIGKPAAEFFQLARRSLPTSTGPVMIVGDDIENDIGGGQHAGLMGVLVKTGRYRQELITEANAVPSAIINSIVDLPELLVSRHYLEAEPA